MFDDIEADSVHYHIGHYGWSSRVARTFPDSGTFMHLRFEREWDTSLPRSATFSLPLSVFANQSLLLSFHNNLIVSVIQSITLIR